MGLALDYLHLLNRTSCADSPVGHHVCDLTRGYFASFSEVDYAASKLRSLHFPPKLRVMCFARHYYITVPADGWLSGSEEKLPFEHRLSKLICPKHFAVRLAKAFHEAGPQGAEGLQWNLMNGLGSRRARVLALLGARGDRGPDIAKATIEIQEALREIAGQKFHQDQLSLGRAKKIRGPEEATAQFHEAVVGSWAAEGRSVEERAASLDAAVDRGLKLLRRQGRPVTECYDILGHALYEMSAGLLISLKWFLSDISHGAGVRRFVKYIQQRHARYAEARRKHGRVRPRKTSAKRGRSFKRHPNRGKSNRPPRAENL